MRCLITPLTAQIVAQEVTVTFSCHARNDLRPLVPTTSLQYTLAAHCVSQLHAAGGRMTYGLPYGSLMLPVRKGATASLSCDGLFLAAYWWQHMCRANDSAPLRTLAPRGLGELCLRMAEMAADCWRRRRRRRGRRTGRGTATTGAGRQLRGQAAGRRRVVGA